jgi:hypothetical protein
MLSAQLEKTIALTNCRSCKAPLKASDNFCRRCGTNQTTCELAGESWNPWSVSVVREALQTTPLTNESLARRLTGTVARRTAPFASSRLGACVVAALITLPIWLLIVLLSPLDALATARALSNSTRG